MKNIFTPFLLFFVLQLNAQTGIHVPTMTQADVLIKNFMTTYQIPGLTFALAKDGKTVYSRAFGFQDVAKTVPTQPHTLFRIASCSKQITSIAIMKLLQEGKLTMASKVFGTGGILETHPVFSTTTISDTRIYDITIQQLLEHSSGWNRDLNCNPNPTTPYPWYFAGCDPISFPLRVTMQLGVPNPVKEDDLIKWLLIKGLDFTPGTQYNYSNIGYLILGDVIEKLSGMSYEVYVQTTILHPLGIYDMHIGKNLLSEKLEREGEYVGGEGNSLSVYGDGSSMPWEYGGMNLNAMSGHGGWIATARDMLTLLNAVDGFTTKPDLLTAPTVATMVSPSVNNANYAKGWAVNTYNNWWHTGAVPGTASQQVRSSNGYTWVIIMNHRYNSNNFWTALDNLGWNIISATSSWPTWDLMLAPTQNATAISFSNITNNSIKVDWQNGNGSNRLLIARPLNPINIFPLDGTNYTANADFASATTLGADEKIVYNGSGNSVTVTGLDASKKYYFRLIEYNNTAATGNNALYLLGYNESSSASTAGVTPVNLISFTAMASGEKVLVDWVTSSEINASHFVIQSSTDGTQFTDIAQVQAKNGTGNKNYRYTDDPNIGLNKNEQYFYRLKMVDLDGTFTYSTIKSVKFTILTSISISPNPAKDLLNINGSNLQKVIILNSSGSKLMEKNIIGSNASVDISTLNAGVYIVKIFTGSGEVTVKKIAVQR